MVMPGRKYQSGTASYRYSINGQEKDKELNENITTALYWEYDSRIGKRWNLDPKQNVWESPYLTFGGNPILFSDILGDKASKPDDWVKDKDGKWIWKEKIKTPEQAKKAGYKEYKAPNSVVDNPDYNKVVDKKTGVADGNKRILLGDNGKIFVGVLGLEVKSNINPSIDDGHVWIGLYDVEFKEKILSYGLWPDFNEKVKDNGPGYDIRIDVEKDRNYKPTSAYYIGITKEQQNLFYKKTKENITWEKTYNCTTWATDCFEVVTKIHFNSTESAMGLQVATPRVLDKSISNSTLFGANSFPENKGKNDGGSSK